VELLTPNELSRILKLHPFIATRLTLEGKLPGFKVGDSWRFRKDEFEKWIAEQTDDDWPIAYTRRRKVAAPHA